MKNLVVFIGAGASAGSIKPGSNSNYQWSPPVTKDIFNIRFDSALNLFESVRGLSGINDEIEDGASLEAYLKRTIGTILGYETLPDNRKLQLKQLPLYLQNLFKDISDRFATTYYQRLVDHILEKEIKVTFISLNYDLLLDKAIETATNIQLDGFSKYFSQQNKWSLIKPHGSVNWFRQITNNHGQDGYTLESWKSIVHQINITNELSPEIYFADLDISHEGSFKEGFINNVPYYPAIAIPNGEYEIIVPVDNFREILIKRLKESNNFLFIGFSAYDKDILNILKQNVLAVDKLLIVSRHKPKEIYERLSKGAPVFTRDTSLTDAVTASTYKGGFELLIKVDPDGNSDLDNFLSSLT